MASYYPCRRLIIKEALSIDHPWSHPLHTPSGRSRSLLDLITGKGEAGGLGAPSFPRDTLQVLFAHKVINSRFLISHRSSFLTGNQAWWGQRSPRYERAVRGSVLGTLNLHLAILRPSLRPGFPEAVAEEPRGPSTPKGTGDNTRGHTEVFSELMYSARWQLPVHFRVEWFPSTPFSHAGTVV